MSVAVATEAAIRVRGGSGLGDALYVQSVVRHLAERGHTNLTALSDWPDVFRPLKRYGVRTAPFSRLEATTTAHYSLGRQRTDTDQWHDVCISAGIDKENPALRLDWVVVDKDLAARTLSQANGKPIVLVHLPRQPMDRKDGFGVDLLPDCRRIQQVIDRLAAGGRVFVLQVGQGKPLFEFPNLDLDLANKTTVAQLLDLASIARGFLGYVSFFVPLAESFSRPALFVWSKRGTAKHQHPSVKAITPQKVIHRKDICRAVFDDASETELDEAADAFLGAL